MLKVVERADIPDMGIDVVEEEILIAARPHELFEIKRPQREIRLVTNGNTANALVVYPQKRTARNHVEAPVLLEKLESRRYVGKLLDFIEEDEGSSRNEFQAWVYQRHLAYDGLRLVALRENRLEFRRINEVYLYETLVVLPCEISYGFGFANLSSPLYEKGISIGVGLPTGKELVKFSRNIRGVHASLLLVLDVFGDKLYQISGLCATAFLKNEPYFHSLS